MGISYAELLAIDKQISDTARSHADVTQNEVKRLSSTLKNLEQISIVEDATFDILNLQEIDLESIVTDAFNQAKKEAESRNVDLRMGPLLGSLKVETSKLDLVLRNLIDNGIKYSDPHCNERFVEICQLPDDADSESLTFCIRDNVIGIPTDKLSDIFNRFHRVHANADEMPNVTGYGIGLSAVREALERMNGTTKVESEVGQGTAFFIRLPRYTNSKRIILPVSDSDRRP